MKRNTLERWIPVKESLPEEFKPVLVFLGNPILGKLIAIARHTGEFWCRYDGQITHWMPLPEKPKGDLFEDVVSALFIVLQHLEWNSSTMKYELEIEGDSRDCDWWQGVLKLTASL